MDPDQDLLDQLDRREAGGTAFAIAVGAGMAAMAGLMTYLTLILELKAGPEIARDTAALVFIVSGALLGARHHRLR